MENVSLVMPELELLRPIDGVNFLDVAYEPIGKAKQLLERNEILNYIAKGMTIAALVVTLICIVVRVILIKRGKNETVK